jgi:hypothetical protein
LKSEFLGQSIPLDVNVTDSNQRNIPISDLPTKEDFESAYKMLTHHGESISIDAVLDQIETNAIENGLTLKNNWRVITEKNIEIWAKKG